MDFSKLKEKAIHLKDKAIEMKDKTIDFTATKISNSSLVLKDQAELDMLVVKSANKSITTAQWEDKVFTKRSLLILWDSNQNFFKEFLASIPILLTKSFSQSIALKIHDIHNTKIDISEYGDITPPAILVFENKALYKVITGEENIKKVVKSLSLDINKTLETL